MGNERNRLWLLKEEQSSNFSEFQRLTAN